MFFNEFAKRLYAEGYIGGKLLSVDGTKIRANNAKRKNFSVKKIDRHIDYIDQRLAEYMDEIDKNDRIEELNERKAKYKAFKERIENGEVTEVSETDPDSRLMMQGNNGIDVSYNVQAAVDSQHGLIAGIMVINEANDQGQLSKVVKSVKENLGLETVIAVGDKGYYDTEDFHECHEAGITTIVAKPKRRSEDREIFAKSDFQYDQEKDCFHCPAGAVLEFYNEDEKGVRRYRNCKACKNCRIRADCSKSKYRVICRHKYAESAARNDSDFVANPNIYKLRQLLSEHPFGTVKRTMGIRQFQTRGLRNVNAEAALIFLCYNLKRLWTIQANNPDNTRDNPLRRTIFMAICLLHLVFRLALKT
jgi:hypothetical protein